MTENILKEQKNNNDNYISSIIINFLKKTSKTDLQSQIDFMNFMNNKIIKTPLFISIIKSLKELKSIKCRDIK